MVWSDGMVVPEHFGWNSLNGAGTSLWVLNGFLQLTVPYAVGKLAGGNREEQLPV